MKYNRAKKTVYIIRHGEAEHNLKASKYENEDGIMLIFNICR